MTDVRTYRAETMQEALDLVRRELGSEAVILHTREVPQPRFLKWRRTRKQVEITASTGVNVRTPAARARMPQSEPVAVMAPAAVMAQPSEDGVSLEIGPEARSLSHQASPANLPMADNSGNVKASVINSRLMQSFVESPVAPSVVNPTTANPGKSGISDQLKSIEQMVKALSLKSQNRRTDEVPSDLFHLYADLIDSEVEDKLAQELICRLKDESAEENIGDVEYAKARLSQMVEAEITCSGPIAVTPGRRKTVALIGPTGVGKTTTIAKLAANFRLRDGIRMGLVTVDTYRIAAVEQLRTYAEIIDLPMKVVTSPLEMRHAMQELAGLDLVLIDTAGRSPRDEVKIQELKNFLSEAEVDEVHLVMSLVASIRSLEATAKQFSVVGVTSTILTKLDEATGMGSLLSAARNIPLPVSYLTTGQDVPDDIEPARAGRMARLVLGQENLFAPS